MADKSSEYKSNIPNASETVENPLIDALEKQGIDITYLSTKLKEELEANEQRVFNSKGEVIYSDGLVSWKTRQEARKDAHKLRGDYPAERKELSGKVSLEQVVKELEGEED